MSAYYASGFHRNRVVFLLTFGLYLLTVILIWVRSTLVFGLTLICITGISSRMMAYFGSELYVGVDIYEHNRIVESIVQLGTLEPLLASKYYYAPIYHLLTASGDIILGVPVKTAGALTALIVVTVVPALIAFTLIRYFWSVQTALVGAFLYTASDHAIRWAVHTIPTSIGLVFFCLLGFGLFRYDREHSKVFLVLSVGILVALTFTHQVSTFIAVIFVCSYLGSRILYEGIVRERVLNLSLLTGFVLTADFIITKYGGPTSEASFFEIVLSTLVSSLLTAGTETRPEVTLPPDPSISGGASAGLDLVHVGGSAILLCLGLVGSLYWLDSKRNPSDLFVGLALGTSVAVMLAFTLGGPIVGMGNLLPMRWFAFIYVPLALLAAIGLKALIQACSSLIGINSRNAVIILVLILLPFIVLMGGNYAGAADNPYFDNAPAAETHGISETEKATFDHTVEYSGETDIVADRRAASIFRDHYGKNVHILAITYGLPETIHRPSLVVDRSYIQTPNSQYIIRFDGQSHVVHGPFPLDEINAQSKSIVYENGGDELNRISGEPDEN
jgi:hypothetical protein